MTHRTLIVTCDARDALPFLRGLPADELEQAVLVVTPHLAEALEDQGMAAHVHVTSGVSTLQEVRLIMGSSPPPVAIVIGPDPGNPLRYRGLVRARLLAPWALGRFARADLLEIGTGGGVRRISTGQTRGTLLGKLYVREGSRLAAYVLHDIVHRPGVFLRAGVALPLALFTLARVLPFIAWHEARALLRARRP